MGQTYKNNQAVQFGICDNMQRVITYAQFQEALIIVNEYKTQLEDHLEFVKKETNNVSRLLNYRLHNYNHNTLLIDAASFRLINILRSNDDKLDLNFKYNDLSKVKLKELRGISMSKFLQCRCAGKMALQELKDLCYYAGVEMSD